MMVEIHPLVRAVGLARAAPAALAVGTPGDDTLIGTPGDDTLDGLAGNDSLQGLKGNDVLIGGQGNDQLDGGLGLDTADYRAASGGVTVSLALQGVAQAIGADQGSDTLNGIENLVGSAFSDRLTGSDAKNVIDLSAGGDDWVAAGDGDDTLVMGASFNGKDRLDGGLGLQDTLLLDGDYSTAVTLTAAGFHSIEQIRLAGGNDYSLKASARSADNIRLLVDGSLLGAGDRLIFDGHKLLTGAVRAIGGAGDDVLSGGLGDDIFDLTHGGDDRVTTGAGDDWVYFGSAFTRADRVVGSGYGTYVFLNGDYDLTIGDNLTNVGSLILTPGNDYHFTLTADAAIHGAEWSSMIGQGWGDGGPTTLYFDGSASSQNLNLIGIEGNDTLIGGSGNDSLTGDYYRGVASDDILIGGAGQDGLYGGEGNDIINGGGGKDYLGYDQFGTDTYVFSAASDSTGTEWDYIGNFNIDQDKIQVPFVVTGVDPKVSGHVRQGTFNADIQALAAGLQPHHAMVVYDQTSNPGTFIIVDFNEIAGYQPGEDLLIATTNLSGTLDIADFI